MSTHIIYLAVYARNRCFKCVTEFVFGHISIGNNGTGNKPEINDFWFVIVRGRGVVAVPVAVEVVQPEFNVYEFGVTMSNVEDFRVYKWLDKSPRCSVPSSRRVRSRGLCV